MATKTEIERLAVVEQEVKEINKTLARLEGKIDNLDGKFAAKWVQTIVAGLVGLILMAFIVALIILVIPSAKHTSITGGLGSSGSSPNSASAGVQEGSTKASDTSSGGGLLNVLPKVPGVN